MWSAPVVIFVPFVKRFSGISQCAKQRFLETFISEFTVEALDEAVLLGLSWRDVMPINARILYPLEDCHACELSAVV